MDLNYSGEDLAFREEVREFLREHLTEDMKRGQRLTPTVLTEPEVAVPWHKALYARGWAAPSWPEEYGGTGWSPMQHYIFENECERAGAPKVSIIGLRMVGPVLIGFGSAEQKALYLPRILCAEDYWCQGYSEPGAGSDLASLSMRAIAHGSDYVLNGSKIWTSHAHHANRMFALVRTDDTGRKQDGITFLLIDMDTPGISVRPIRSIGGEHEVNQVFFDDVRVPMSNRVGEEGKGWSYGKYLLEFERSGGAVSARLRAALSRVVSAMGLPATDASAATCHSEIADAACRIEIDLDCLAMTEMRVLAQLQRASRPGQMSSLLKLRASELQQDIAHLGLDVLGQQAIPWEPHRPLYELQGSRVMPEEVLALASLYLNSRGYTIFGGSIEMQHEILARNVLGK